MSKNILKLKFLVGFIFIALNSLKAQNELIVMGGEKGNYILNPFKIASTKFPNGNIVSYKIERSENNGSTYETISLFNTPENYKEFSENYKKAMVESIIPNELNSNEINQCWNAFSKYQTLDSIANYLNYQSILLAFNLLILDKTATVNKSYIYKISALDNNEKEIEFKISKPVYFPAIMNYTKPKFYNYSISEGKINLIFKAAKVGKKPNHFAVFKKQTGSQNDFEKIDLSKNISVEKDSWVYAYSDANVSDALTYFYAISPSNQFGNYNILSDTGVATVFETKETLIPQNFKAIPLDSTDAIQLSWNLVNPHAIGSVQLYRGKDYEGEYNLISTFNPFETMYIDNGVEQGIKYYYYLKITDKYARNSHNGARIFGLMSGKNAPSSVSIFTAKNTDKGIVLEWMPNGSNIRGFYLYKTYSIDGNAEPVGQFIEYDSKKEFYEFIDTVSNLKNTNLIGYSISQENNGHVESQLFEWQYVINQLNVANNLMQYQIEAIEYGNKVILTWQNKLNTNVNGYNIYRKYANEKEKTKLNMFELLPNSLSFIDTTYKNAHSALYYLEPVMANLSKGKFFESNEIQLTNNVPSSPYGLKLLVQGGNALLSWSYFDNTTITAFDIYKWQVGEEPQKIASIKPSEKTYQDKISNSNIAIYYYIKAVNEFGESESSSKIELISNK